MLSADEKPDISYADIGGLDTQKQGVREAIELPLTHYSCTSRLASTRHEVIKLKKYF